MVTLSLTILSSLPVLTASPYPEVKSVALSSAIPEKKLIAMLASEKDQDAFSDTPIPQSEIVAMLATTPIEEQAESSNEPSLTPSITPTAIPTATPTPILPQPKADRPLAETETPAPTPTTTPTSTPTQATQLQPSSGDLDSFFSRYSDEYNVDKELLKRIAACESGFNASSYNTAYDYGGMYQFASGTWSTVRGRMGADPNPEFRFSAEESIKTAAYHIANGGQGAWPNCR